MGKEGEGVKSRNTCKGPVGTDNGVGSAFGSGCWTEQGRATGEKMVTTVTEQQFFKKWFTRFDAGEFLLDGAL